uniref:Uncharacterized protein n=1 Tax=Anguilla anguilla TaxID=7936 RepID=A0A0E9P8U6_ANGAN
MNCWRNWKSWNRRNWTRTCWKSAAQRTYRCPTCRPHRYLPDQQRKGGRGRG